MRAFLFTLFIFLFFLGTSNSCFSQVGVSVGQTHPRGDFGKVFKPATTFEFNYYVTDVDEKFRLAISLGYMRLKTVQDTFKIYGYRSEGDGTILDSGYELYKAYISIPFALKSGYHILESSLTPTIGIDVYVFFNSYNYESQIPALINKSEQASSVFLGYQGRIGLNYEISDEFNMDLDFGRTATWEQGDGKFTFWKTAFTLNYFIYSNP